MLLETRYSIVKMVDSEGNKKEDELGLMKLNYYIQHLSKGSRGILVSNDKTGEHVRTSPIQDIRFWENHIILETQNTVYTLKAIIKPLVRGV